MHGFVRNLITEWRRLGMPFEKATVVLGVSGGADSVSLLLAMHDLIERKKLGLRLVAAHFNHMLRDGESNGDEEFVRRLTSERGIEFATARSQVKSEGNLEQNARRARYEFLKKTAEGVNAQIVITGHTINDQAETLLMNLIRGSGIDGLSGMRTVRELAIDAELRQPALPGSQLLLVRPLLSWATRKDTEEYCVESSVEYRYDTMNEDTAFKRVRIRKVLLPLLEDMNPKIVETLANTAELMQHAAQSGELATDKNGDAELRLADLRAMSQGDLYKMLRDWLSTKRGDTRRLQLNHIRAIERLISSDKSGRIVELPGGTRVIRSNGRLMYEKN